MPNSTLPSRVNIRLDMDTSGHKEKVELPFNLLVIDDFNPGGQKQALAEQERLLVHKKNLDDVMKKINPSLHLIVDNAICPGEELSVTLQFEKMADFRPEHLVQKVPALKRLLAMRRLLKELKSNVNNSVAFRKTLESIMKDKDSIHELKKAFSTQKGDEYENV